MEMDRINFQQMVQRIDGFLDDNPGGPAWVWAKMAVKIQASDMLGSAIVELNEANGKTVAYTGSLRLAAAFEAIMANSIDSDATDNLIWIGNESNPMTSKFLIIFEETLCRT
jgi:hypothetical protein